MTRLTAEPCPKFCGFARMSVKRQSAQFLEKITRCTNSPEDLRNLKNDTTVSHVTNCLILSPN